jgi:phospholipid-translocating ATPase
LRHILEERLTFVGITGVEDTLQDDCKETLEKLKDAGIKVWMLTGDKVETACCIASSCGLRGRN